MDQVIVSVINRALFSQQSPGHIRIMNIRRNVSRVHRLGVLGVIKSKLIFEVASIAIWTRDSKSRITEVNRGGSNAN
jgi:hypothetical protein